MHNIACLRATGMLLMGIGVGESPLNSVQLLRENISHKQTLTKTCHANICFLSRFFMQKSLSRYSRNLHRSLKYFNIRTQSVLPWSQWKTKYQPSKFIFHSPRGIQILILGNATFQFLGNCEYMRDKSEGFDEALCILNRQEDKRTLS